MGRNPQSARRWPAPARFWHGTAIGPLHGGAPPGRFLHGDESGSAAARQPQVVILAGFEGIAGGPAAVGFERGRTLGSGERDLSAAAGDHSLPGHAKGCAVRPGVLGHIVGIFGDEQRADDQHRPHQDLLHRDQGTGYRVQGTGYRVQAAECGRWPQENRTQNAGSMPQVTGCGLPAESRWWLVAGSWWPVADGRLGECARAARGPQM